MTNYPREQGQVGSRKPSRAVSLATDEARFEFVFSDGPALVDSPTVRNVRLRTWPNRLDTSSNHLDDPSRDIDEPFKKY